MGRDSVQDHNEKAQRAATGLRTAVQIINHRCSVVDPGGELNV